MYFPKDHTHTTTTSSLSPPRLQHSFLCVNYAVIITGTHIMCSTVTQGYDKRVPLKKAKIHHK